MNENELIDILDKYAKSGMTSSIANTNVQKIVTTLRQQQAEIEKLEKLMNFWKESYNELRTRNEQ